MRVYNAIIINDGDILSVSTFTNKEDALAVINAERKRVADKYGNSEVHDFYKSEAQKDIFGMQYYEKEGFSWENNCEWGSAQVVWSDIDAKAVTEPKTKSMTKYRLIACLIDDDNMPKSAYKDLLKLQEDCTDGVEVMQKYTCESNKVEEFPINDDKFILDSDGDGFYLYERIDEEPVSVPTPEPFPIKKDVDDDEGEVMFDLTTEVYDQRADRLANFGVDVMEYVLATNGDVALFDALDAVIPEKRFTISDIHNLYNSLVLIWYKGVHYYKPDPSFQEMLHECTNTKLVELIRKKMEERGIDVK